MSQYFSISRSALKQIIQSLKENPNKQTRGCDSDMLILHHDILVSRAESRRYWTVGEEDGSLKPTLCLSHNPETQQ